MLAQMLVREVEYDRIAYGTEGFHVDLTNSAEVQEIIKHLKNKKSVGSDEIPVSLYALSLPRLLSHVIVAFLTGICLRLSRWTKSKPFTKN